MLAFVACFAASEARADGVRDDAKREFTKGERAFARGEYLSAAEAFEAANRLVPHHSALWNAARARELGGDAAGAANRYAQFLRVAPRSASDRDAATNALARLSKRLGKLTLLGTTPAAVDGVHLDAGDSLYVTPGLHLIVRESTGNQAAARRELSFAAGEESSLTMDEATPPKPAAPPVPPPVLVPRPAESPRSKPLPPWVAFTGAGVTALFAGLTVWSGLDTISARSDYDQNPTSDQWVDGKGLRTRTNVLLSTTIVMGLATVGIAVFLVDWNRGPKVGLGHDGVRLSGTF